MYHPAHDPFDDRPLWGHKLSGIGETRRRSAVLVRRESVSAEAGDGVEGCRTVTSSPLPGVLTRQFLSPVPTPCPGGGCRAPPPASWSARRQPCAGPRTNAARSRLVDVQSPSSDRPVASARLMEPITVPMPPRRRPRRGRHSQADRRPTVRRSRRDDR
jgi:hypothetical protein